jgi:hypothetical protein
MILSPLNRLLSVLAAVESFRILSDKFLICLYNLVLYFEDLLFALKAPNNLSSTYGGNAWKDMAYPFQDFS